MKTKVLFLCTGNYYRSRFAELLFNHWAPKRNLPWVADSRALALELGIYNVGPISSYTLDGLQQRAIPVDTEVRNPQPVTESDWQAAQLVIALDRQEHQRYVEERWPAWTDQVHYWEIADLHLLTATDALGRIEAHVLALLDTLATENVSGATR